MSNWDRGLIIIRYTFSCQRYTNICKLVVGISCFILYWNDDIFIIELSAWHKVMDKLKIRWKIRAEGKGIKARKDRQIGAIITRLRHSKWARRNGTKERRHPPRSARPKWLRKYGVILQFTGESLDFPTPPALRRPLVKPWFNYEKPGDHSSQRNPLSSIVRKVDINSLSPTLPLPSIRMFLDAN